MGHQDRQLVYIGSSKKDAEKLPQDVKDLFLDALMVALMGGTHQDAKPFKYYGSGVFEVVGDHRSSTFRESTRCDIQRLFTSFMSFRKKAKKGKKPPRKT